MRHFAPKLAAVIAFGVLATSVCTCLADEIQWATDIDQARLSAARQNKLLLIHFWTPTCGPCKSIDRNVFPNQGVARTINQNYVPLKVNAAETQALAKHFGVTRYPTDIISTVDGQAVHRMITLQNALSYARELGKLANQHATAAQYRPQQSVATNNSTPTQTQNPNQMVARSPVQPPVGQRRASAQSNFSPSHAQANMQPLTGNHARASMHPIPPSAAVARQPGLDPSKRPGTGLGVNRPGYSPRFANNQPAVQPAQRPMQGGQQAAQTPQATSQNLAAQNQSQSANANGYTPLISNPYAARGGNAPAGMTPSQQTTQPSMAQQPAGQQQPTGQQQPAGQQPGVQQYAQPATNNQQPNFESPRPQPPGSGAANATATSQVAQQQPSNTAPNNDITPIPPSKNPPMGLEGRCPVWLIDNGSWMKGDKRWGAVHRGVTYLFSSAEAQQKFLAAPDDYSPVLAGMDVVRLAANGMVNQGTREYGVLFDDDGKGPRKSRMFLFDSVETRNLFEAEPDRYLQPVMQAMLSGQLDRLVR